ncbi:hypothetical protein FHS82_003948 [Pseudochelatococcus lubricantis]|uniref:Uncharacterized protein n=1 Tax=Pseudochelatococcus lubricantis TaxID=1538102 RepID=A0ABX0V4Q0_9HYPH|nr:helix-turn-helix domain-containing protein [Pseudochelatococcus lubricantis]NIJ60082.1 hypothetical protein [Pseudochelatococcus lubricantis]
MVDEEAHELPEADEFPGVLGEIAEVAGIEAALIIARIKGGSLAFFPSSAALHADHWLVDAVGFDAARKITDHLVSAQLGDRFHVPRGPESSRAHLKRRLRRAFFSTATIDSAALALGVDRSTIIRHWARMRKEGFRRPEAPSRGCRK